MKFLALTDCPQGQRAGQVFEATEDAGHVLELVGAAKRVDDSIHEPPLSEEPDPKSEPRSEPRRRQYRRHDLTAQD